MARVDRPCSRQMEGERKWQAGCSRGPWLGVNAARPNRPRVLPGRPAPT